MLDNFLRILTLITEIFGFLYNQILWAVKKENISFNFNIKNCKNGIKYDINYLLKSFATTLFLV